MTLLNPYLTFDGTAAEAMDFYQDVFGGELALNTYDEFGQSGPAGGRVMHAMLETTDGLVLMASDTPPDDPATQSGNVSICLSGDDEPTLRDTWRKLSDGGTVTMPLETQFWGDMYGSCIDRFGIVWRFNINQAT